MLFGFRRQSIRNKRRAQNRYCHVLLYPWVKNTYCEGLVQDYRMDFTKLCKWLEDAIVILIIYPKASGHQRLAVNLTLFLILPRTYLHTSARFPRISPNHRHDMQLHLFLGSHVIPTGVTHLAFSLRHIFLRRKSIDFITIALTVPFQSIRQAPWCVTGSPEFWFRQPPKVAVTYRDFGEIFGSLAPQATNFFYIHQMNSARSQNHRDVTKISAVRGSPWRVTAELIEMVQYGCFCHSHSNCVCTVSINHLFNQPFVSRQGCGAAYEALFQREVFFDKLQIRFT